MYFSITLQSLSLFLLILYIFSKTQFSKKKPTIHGLKSYPLIGYLPHFIRNRHRFLEWVTELILQSPTRTMGFSSPGTTSGIIIVIGDRAIERGGEVELQDVLERFSFDSICKVAFGEDPACLTEEQEGFEGTNSTELMTAFAQAQDLTVARFIEPIEGMYKLKKILNIGSEKRLKESISIVHGYAMKIIRARQGMDLEGKEDILSRSAANKDHNVEELRDIVISFLLASRETTSTALTWMSCKEDDILPDGTFVGKGWFVMYSAYAMGRSEKIWGKDCLEFKPERWLNEQGVFTPESPFRYWKSRVFIIQ
ncbi:hypothetical protein LUZ60_017474 [Juncus effusus]|nr:hypothetical protein LUZ60_017474 [Juncus effusus]